MIARRGFLLGLGAALATPAIVRAESLMKIVMPRRQVVPHMFGDDLAIAIRYTGRILVDLIPKIYDAERIRLPAAYVPYQLGSPAEAMRSRIVTAVMFSRPGG